MKNYIIHFSGILLFFFPLFAQAQDENEAKVYVSSDQLKKSGYSLLFEDAFNKPGKPSPGDWLFRNNAKLGGVSSPENVIIGSSNDGSNEGCLLIKFTYDSTRKADEKYVGGGVVSTHNFGYGYYETKVKLYGGNSDFKGLHQSFWSMGLTGTNEGEGKGVKDSLVKTGAIPFDNWVLEIDGFEADSKNNILAQNYHIYTPVHISSAPINDKIAKDLNKWIVIGYNWMPDRIDFYCDGQYFTTKKLKGKWKVFAPQNFWFTALPVSLADWGGINKPPANAAMQIDYFRYYAKKLTGINRIGNEGFEYGKPENIYPIAWIVTPGNENVSQVKVVTDSVSSFNGQRYLMIGDEKQYQATVKQVIEYIPNGDYKFSAMVKSSGKQKKAILVIKTGTKETTIPIIASNSWTNISVDRINISDNHATVQIQVEGDAGHWLMVDQVEFFEK